MKAVLLEPHNDDAVLFASFTCIREKPHVITCLRSQRQGNNYARRELESFTALGILGCTWEQWPYPDYDPSWPRLKQSIRELADRYEMCYAPFPRYTSNGHDPMNTPLDCGVCQHDKIGEIASDVFGDRYVGYLTYTRSSGKDTNGRLVDFESDWPLLKLKALACYHSQLTRPEIVPHFLGDQHEYYAAP